MLPENFVQPYKNEKSLHATRTKLRFRCLPSEGTFLQINSSILAKPNSLVRKLNAKTRELSERYGIRYMGHREENVKYLILERVSDTSDTYDISDTPPGA